MPLNREFILSATKNLLFALFVSSLTSSKNHFHISFTFRPPTKLDKKPVGKPNEKSKPTNWRLPFATFFWSSPVKYSYAENRVLKYFGWCLVSIVSFWAIKIESADGFLGLGCDLADQSIANT